MKSYLVIVLMLGTALLAVAAPASAIQCAPPTGDPSLVGQVEDHARTQCQAAIDTVYGGDIVRDSLDMVDASCVFVTGSTCIP